MKNKSLVLRYALLFCVAVFFTAAFLNTYKNEKIKTQLQNYDISVNKAYVNAYDKTKDISELIFFNNLLYDKKIIDLYNASNTNNESSKKELFLYLKDKYFHFKSYGIRQINFYFPNNEVFLQMKNQNLDDKNGKDKHKYVSYVNNSLEEIDGLEVGSSFASLKFIKPIFDDKLNHIGSIELEFSLDYVANLMEKSLDFNILFLFEKQIIQNNIHKSKIEAFKEFYLNKNYMYEDNKYSSSKYTKELFDSIKNKNYLKIDSSMSISKTFSFTYEHLNIYYPAVFIPVFSTINKKSESYIFAFATNENSTISMIMDQFEFLFYIFMILYLILFIVLFYANKFSLDKKTIAKKYQDLVDAIDKYVVMVETDKRGVIVEVTEAFCDICGYTKKELIGKNVNIIRHPDVSKKFFENLWRDLFKNKKWEGEIKNLDKYGNSYWVKGTIFAKYDERGKIIGFISIRVNVTDAKQLKKINLLLKEDLSNKLNEIKMKDKNLMDNTKVALMGKVLDSVSHQWKNPMSNISIELANLSARISKNDINLEALNQIHNKIEIQLKSLSVTLNEFKSSFTQDQRNDKYNVYSAVRESISLVRDEAKLHNITISLNSKKEIYCFGVFNELKHIVMNLLKNSIEQLISNNITNGVIDLSIIEDEGNILIKCSDNAKGDSKNIIDKVFSDNYDEKVNKDIGINLYITKLLIEKSGAKIWFENKEDSTTFYIKLVSEERRNKGRL